MAPPNVVIVGPSAGAPGGIAQFTQRLGEAMTAHGRVRVVALERLYPGWTPPGRGTSGTTPTVAESIIRTTAWSPWTWRRARREIARNAPDLLVVQWWHPVFGPLLRSLMRSSNRAGARTVVICHNAVPHERFPFARRLTARTLTEADEIVALCDAVATQARTIAPGVPLTRLEHPPNLTMQRALRRGSPDGRAALLFFGNVRAYKGVADLLDALPAIDAQVPVRLVVAGRFLGSAPQYRRQIRRLGIESLVELRDTYVPDDEVGALFGDADLLVMPYRDASQSGLVSLAAQAGTPVVATDVGGLRQTLGDGAVVVPPRDRAALVDGIVRALRTPPPPPAAPRMGWEAFSAALLNGRARTSAASA